jgi:hypothetical protein
MNWTGRAGISGRRPILGRRDRGADRPRRLKSHASVWFGAVLRGDNEWIEIGERSQIQDNATLHTDPGFPMVTGSNCVIGHKVMLHGCMVGDNSLIGMSDAAQRQDRQQLAGRRRRAGDRARRLDT